MKAEAFLARAVLAAFPHALARADKILGPGAPMADRHDHAADEARQAGLALLSNLADEGHTFAGEDPE